MKKVYFSGVCGTGTGAVAGLFKQKGWVVVGSDKAFMPPVSDMLESEGITMLKGYNASNLPKDARVAVIGNALSKDNPEVVAILESKMEYHSFPSALEKYFLADTKNIVISGTHGKTTTSSMCATLLHHSGAEPSFMIGGILPEFGRGFNLGKGRLFVLEGDEYDTAFFDKKSKFLHYRPHTAVITGIEFDHADIFKNIESIEQMFLEFVALIPKTGVILVDKSSKRALKIAARAKCPAQTYGLDKSCNWYAANISYNSTGAEFDIYRDRKFISRLYSSFSGEHNIKNALAAIAAAVLNGVDIVTAIKGLEKFKGVKRRQELKYTINDIMVFDDYAHHPTAVYETIKSMKQHYPNKRLIAVFEPKTNTSRSNIFQSEYEKAFEFADMAIISNLPKDNRLRNAEHSMDINKLLKGINNRGIPAKNPGNGVDIAKFLATEAKGGDLLLIMSAGNFDGIFEHLKSNLSKRGFID